MARELAKRSLCDRDQVGCVITDVNNKVIGEGYNGPPRGFWHGNAGCTQWCQRTVNASIAMKLDGREDRGLSADYSDCPSLHAEANALLTSDRTLRMGGTIYVTSDVCIACAKLIANSGLLTVIVDTERAASHRDPGASYDFLVACGLEVRVNSVNLSRKASQA